MNEIPPPIDSPPPDYNTAVNGPQNPIGKLINKYYNTIFVWNLFLTFSEAKKTVPYTIGDCDYNNLSPVLISCHTIIAILFCSFACSVTFESECHNVLKGHLPMRLSNMKNYVQICVRLP